MLLDLAGKFLRPTLRINERLMAGTHVRHLQGFELWQK
jgi:hypothetical protein